MAREGADAVRWEDVEGEDEGGETKVGEEEEVSAAVASKASGRGQDMELLAVVPHAVVLP